MRSTCAPEIRLHANAVDQKIVAAVDADRRCIARAEDVDAPTLPPG
jgi:hypothetical protein